MLAVVSAYLKHNPKQELYVGLPVKVYVSGASDCPL